MNVAQPGVFAVAQSATTLGGLFTTVTGCSNSDVQTVRSNTLFVNCTPASSSQLSAGEIAGIAVGTIVIG